MNNKRKAYQILIFFLVLLIMLLGIISINNNSSNNGSNNNHVNNAPTETIIDTQKLNIFYFDVGQADSFLITNNGESLLIDGGNEADSQNLINYMENLNITGLDYVVATHADRDHIGGLDKIIREFRNRSSIYAEY